MAMVRKYNLSIRNYTMQSKDRGRRKEDWMEYKQKLQCEMMMIKFNNIRDENGWGFDELWDLQLKHIKRRVGVGG